MNGDALLLIDLVLTWSFQLSICEIDYCLLTCVKILFFFELIWLILTFIKQLKSFIDYLVQDAKVKSMVEYSFLD